MSDLPLHAEQKLVMPALALRDVVIFPHMVLPLFVGREKSIAALEAASQGDKWIFLTAQKDSDKDDPLSSDLYELGCVGRVLQMLKLPDGTVKVLVEGLQRGRALEYVSDEPYYQAMVEVLAQGTVSERENEALSHLILSEFEKYLKNNRKVPAEILSSLMGIDDVARLSDSVIAHLPLKLTVKQQLLEILDVPKRVEELISCIGSELEIMEMENRIKGRVKGQMEKRQRDYYLNEQLEAIKKEMTGEEGAEDEVKQLEEKIKLLPESVREKAQSELKKLNAMPPMSAEASVSRNYLDTLVNVPWTEATPVNKNLREAIDILEKDHYGLKEVKERIIEYIGVQQRVQKVKGPVLCFVGPPGVGKTSLGESIARATGRHFARVSLGGVRDEAEIRGHRRTYIGALPGKIIQKLIKAKVRNPLFLLDEVDKMAMDFRGDPASALLEVLDPEQNNTFNDHYLEVDYDLSDVMFICTANSLNIPEALLDRMEVIRLAGYTEDEKINIAKRHLLSKQMAIHGLANKEFSMSTDVLRDIIRYYTRESGVRNLERAIAKCCRKAVKELLIEKGRKKILITKRNLEHYLGVEKFRFGKADEEDRVGQVTGLAWTQVGGELLTIEACAVAGKGKATYTGHLGDVMQESIQAAMTVVRSRAKQLGIHPDFYTKMDIHVHVPEGATPKDGPSAGIGMCTALVSALTGIPVKASVAMTGEITLRGEVLPIGGLKEKLLAAHRGGIKTVLIPYENRAELKEIPANITKSLVIKPVRWIDEVLTLALDHLPTPLKEKEKIIGTEVIGEVILDKEAKRGSKTQRSKTDRPH